MTRYVIAFAHALPSYRPHNVLLIEKLKPAWQNGLFNLPGGHIEEDDDSPEDAAVRELWEETGIRADRSLCKILGTIEGPQFHITVVLCPYRDWFNGRDQKPLMLTKERPFILSVEDALAAPQLIPNLKLVIAFAVAGVSGWTIRSILDEKVETQWIVDMTPRNPAHDDFFARLAEKATAPTPENYID